jgi:hypothetical protein
MITFGPMRVTVIAIAAALLPAATAVGAAEPTLSDIAGCNQQAAQKTGASALPAPPGARGPEVAKRAPDGSREPRELPAHGGIPVAGAPGAKAEHPQESGATRGEKTDPSGAIITQSPDPLLKGMDAGKADDPAYRAAYRECMRARRGR